MLVFTQKPKEIFTWLHSHKFGSWIICVYSSQTARMPNTQGVCLCLCSVSLILNSSLTRDSGYIPLVFTFPLSSPLFPSSQQSRTNRGWSEQPILMLRSLFVQKLQLCSWLSYLDLPCAQQFIKPCQTFCSYLMWTQGNYLHQEYCWRDLKTSQSVGQRLRNKVVGRWLLLTMWQSFCQSHAQGSNSSPMCVLIHLPPTRKDQHAHAHFAPPLPYRWFLPFKLCPSARFPVDLSVLKVL